MQKEKEVPWHGHGTEARAVDIQLQGCLMHVLLSFSRFYTIPETSSPNASGSILQIRCQHLGRNLFCSDNLDFAPELLNQVWPDTTTTTTTTTTTIINVECYSGIQKKGQSKKTGLKQVSGIDSQKQFKYNHSTDNICEREITRSVSEVYTGRPGRFQSPSFSTQHDVQASYIAHSLVESSPRFALAPSLGIKC